MLHEAVRKVRAGVPTPWTRSFRVACLLLGYATCLIAVADTRSRAPSARATYVTVIDSEESPVLGVRALLDVVVLLALLEEADVLGVPDLSGLSDGSGLSDEFGLSDESGVSDGLDVSAPTGACSSFFFCVPATTRVPVAGSPSSKNAFTTCVPTESVARYSGFTDTMTLPAFASYHCASSSSSPMANPVKRPNVWSSSTLRLKVKMAGSLDPWVHVTSPPTQR